MREFLYKFLTEGTPVGSGLSSTNDADNLLTYQVYISTGKEKNRRINNLLEVGRIIIIKKSVVTKYGDLGYTAIPFRQLRDG